MERPTLEESTEQLRQVSGAMDLLPDTPLLSAGDVDSLDLMEWLYGFQERYPHIQADESLFNDMDESVTFRSIFERIMADVPAGI